MGTLSDYRGRPIYHYDGDILRNHQGQYLFKGNAQEVSYYKGGRKFLVRNGNVISEFQGRKLYEIRGNYVYEYQGQPLFRLTGRYLDDYRTGTHQIQIEGNVPLIMVLACML